MPILLKHPLSDVPFHPDHSLFGTFDRAKVKHLKLFRYTIFSLNPLVELRLERNAEYKIYITSATYGECIGIYIESETFQSAAYYYDHLSQILPSFIEFLRDLDFALRIYDNRHITHIFTAPPRHGKASITIYISSPDCQTEENVHIEEGPSICRDDLQRNPGLANLVHQIAQIHRQSISALLYLLSEHADQTDL